MEFIHDVWGLFTQFIEFFVLVGLVGLIMLYVYDKYVQRSHALLINYPIIGRFRYFFEALREPFRQYFGEETFYDSKDKVDWVYKAAKNVPNYKSFSISQPFLDSKFIVKHVSNVLNDNEVNEDMSVVFGKNREIPFVSHTPIIRSAMSDGALSPEAIRAFALAGVESTLTINTGEGSLTSNHLYTHRPDLNNCDYLEIVKSTQFAEFVFKIGSFFFNNSIATKWYRTILLHKNTQNTYIYDKTTNVLFRVNWNAPLEAFPKEIPSDIPNIVFQIGSGLYGVRDANGKFDELKYQKVMKFCRMTEIKIAQGAKQTGGKLAGSKVTADIAYYRGVPEGKDVFSPNRFPYADTTSHLLDFVEKLQNLSKKPVGFKIVISDSNAVEEMAKEIASRKSAGKNIPDFITIDSGEGGSATAPLELMESVGLATDNALYILDAMLKKYNIRQDIKIIASGKILTPDDVIITMCMGADAVGIARGFMMSGGCIRARMCSGFGTHVCPVGMATQDEKKRASYLVVRKGHEIASYHINLIKGMKMMMAVMGIDSINKLDKSKLTFKDRNGEIYFDIDEYFQHKLHN
ncbi:MAG: glutamate synthase [Sulfurimonas sp. RIFCSPHIGHO2_12_FULL_36_9]|uniref:FMN-binding glutamate synthase family protein n=1 Tax=Sulfurimonas sp. RIFCSPLOWO2_12_36_12 TaxID=1802253 RepID=UPI0008CF52A9|nr:FMN-binding glutamate synthase family protein [Sulfurimonas sp. RIFCSPLOWO2_12_36_12]OHD99482.1 MAG: glutamate synthase [Sulfurimonas sp. RIFCSPHIGHO2_12_FULL_36_9]OHD99765.1 MAG: glutamate synthase [Sulfurimonas sp. RIFCSPLOWO2_02_FULL_36_28]OHE00805.1 MAG: glutamate synthase [Sulfurimonas sp. RIFCSPLOWO2_12_36_12]OHE03380.1 MAG: glutamate synthase [Sulfurimonas sp. RIFCSPLOWO2_12_FULL_36_74]